MISLFLRSNMVILCLVVTLCAIFPTYISAEDAGKNNGNDSYWDTSCSEYKSCGDCYSSAYCHWCAYDEACHTIGSWYGCAYGVDCNSIDRCMRTEPEKAGYTVKGYLAMTGLGLATFGILMWLRDSPSSDIGSNNYVRNDIDSSISNVEKEETALAIQMDEKGSYGSCLRSGVRGGGGHDSIQTNFVAVGNASASVSNTIGWKHLGQTIKTLAIAIAVVLLVIIIPKLPEINICSTEFDWESIIEGIQDGGFQASFDTLVSIHNPSIYDVQIDTVEASFFHNEMLFGKFSMQPTLIESQSITDDLVVVTFAPENSEVMYDLVSDYSSGLLNITVNAKIGATFPSLLGASFSRSIDGIFVDLSEDANESDNNDNESTNNYLEDKHLCACS